VSGRLVATGCALIAFGFGWGFGREDAMARHPPVPVTLTCPAIPACPAPIVHAPPAKVIMTRCDPLEDLRVAPVARPAKVAEASP
jgi:hypothetical protein